MLLLAEKETCIDEIFAGYECFVGVGENITSKIGTGINRTPST
jgi:hypothetical protein